MNETIISAETIKASGSETGSKPAEKQTNTEEFDLLTSCQDNALEMLRGLGVGPDGVAYIEILYNGDIVHVISPKHDLLGHPNSDDNTYADEIFPQDLTLLSDDAIKILGETVIRFQNQVNSVYAAAHENSQGVSDLSLSINFDGVYGNFYELYIKPDGEIVENHLVGYMYDGTAIPVHPQTIQEATNSLYEIYSNVFNSLVEGLCPDIEFAAAGRPFNPNL